MITAIRNWISRLLSPYRGKQSLPIAVPPGNRICIARNPMADGKQGQNQRLVIENGYELPASDVVIQTGFDPAVEPQGYELIATYVCRGYVAWLGSVAVIH